MRNRYDQLAKRLARRAFEPLGRTRVQHEISPNAQYADIYHVPDPARSKERARLGLLGRLSSEPCLIEVFSHTPSVRDICACLGKYMVAWTPDGSKGRGKAKKQGADTPDPPPSFLWIIATGRPERVLAEAGSRAKGWPEGVYFLPSFFRVGIIVASELPRERSTLLVRLMAAGSLLAEAIDELAALPKDAHEHSVAAQILLQLRHALEKAPDRSPEQEEIFVSSQNLVEKLWNDGRREGRQEGRQEGMSMARKAVLRVLGARSLTPTPAQAARIEGCADLATLDRWLGQALVANSVAEALRGPPPEQVVSTRPRPALGRRSRARADGKVNGGE